MSYINRTSNRKVKLLNRKKRYLISVLKYLKTLIAYTEIGE